MHRKYSVSWGATSCPQWEIYLSLDPNLRYSPHPSPLRSLHLSLMKSLRKPLGLLISSLPRVGSICAFTWGLRGQECNHSRQNGSKPWSLEECPLLYLLRHSFSPGRPLSLSLHLCHHHYPHPLTFDLSLTAEPEISIQTKCFSFCDTHRSWMLGQGYSLHWLSLVCQGHL